jgi:hypothetical protein
VGPNFMGVADDSSIIYSIVVGPEVLTAVTMKRTVFWIVPPCSLVDVHGSFPPGRMKFFTCNKETSGYAVA